MLPECVRFVCDAVTTCPLKQSLITSGESLRLLGAEPQHIQSSRSRPCASHRPRPHAPCGNPCRWWTRLGSV